MTVFISHTTIDSHDAYALSTWWKQITGDTDLPDDPNLLRWAADQRRA